MSEQEARAELAQLYDRLRKLHIFWKMKQVLTAQKQQDQIESLHQKLSNNSMLWEQMAEAEKREHVLKQELIMTQQNLSNCEKVIEKQKD